ncbi:MAG: phasin family protein [Pseudomonadota bacterium]
MVKKMQKNTVSQKEDDTSVKNSVKDSAQQIWQAGLGAFNKAQMEGTKAFEALVKEGVNLQRKTQTAAEERISEATNAMSTMATDISSKASGQWDKLENIFEDRVAKVLNKLGVPSAKDISILIARIDELNRSVQKLTEEAAASKSATQSTPKASRKSPPPKAVKTTAKPVAKRAPARKTAKGTLDNKP